jgi:ribosomal protein L1
MVAPNQHYHRIETADIQWRIKMDETQEQHRVRYAVVFAKVQMAAERDGVVSKAAVDLKALKEGMEAYIHAKTAWTTNNTDETMIHLVGKWARMSKLLREADEKYA